MGKSLNDLRQLMVERIANKLRRNSVTTCSRYAETYRVMNRPAGNWRFSKHPWSKKMHDTNHPRVVGQKSAQMAYTETAINRMFYKIDIEHVDCLYILPSKTPDASDFSSARFDAALELSEHLASLFSDTKNVGHKRAGSVNLYIRGSRSRSGLKSLPAGFIVFDEVDEMPMENIPLAEERASGYEDKQFYYISTPTVPDFGINSLFKLSDQQHYFFKCPHCGRHTELIFPDCLVILGDDYSDPRVKDSYIICYECKVKLEHAEKRLWLSTASWEPTVANQVYEGYYINQLYSMTVSPPEIALLCLQAGSDPATEQELYNSKAGLPHAVEGARVTDSHIDSSCGTHENGTLAPSNALITMGVDVGTWLHYEIAAWYVNDSHAEYDINLAARAKVLEVGKKADFAELDSLMRRFNVMFAVVDANPERRMAEEFKTRWEGIVRLCFYGNDVKGKTIVDKEDEGLMTVDRTSWMDMALGRIKSTKKKIIFPHNLPIEYRDQLKAVTRIYKKDQYGNPIGAYVASKPDHFAHARTYNELALVMSTTRAQPIPL